MSSPATSRAVRTPLPSPACRARARTPRRPRRPGPTDRLGDRMPVQGQCRGLVEEGLLGLGIGRRRGAGKMSSAASCEGASTSVIQAPAVSLPGPGTLSRWTLPAPAPRLLDRDTLVMQQISPGSSANDFDIIAAPVSRSPGMSRPGSGVTRFFAGSRSLDVADADGTPLLHVRILSGDQLRPLRALRPRRHPAGRARQPLLDLLDPGVHDHGRWRRARAAGAIRWAWTSRSRCRARSPRGWAGSGRA